MSQLFALGGQSIGASASVPPMNIHYILNLLLITYLIFFFWGMGVAPVTLFLTFCFHCFFVGITLINTAFRLMGKFLIMYEHLHGHMG